MVRRRLQSFDRFLKVLVYNRSQVRRLPDPLRCAGSPHVPSNGGGAGQTSAATIGPGRIPGSDFRSQTEVLQRSMD